MMMTTKLPILLTCAEKKRRSVVQSINQPINQFSQSSLVYHTKNHELQPISTGPISRGSQSGVSTMVRDLGLWRKGFTKKVSFEFRVERWWMEKVEMG